jgi:hypothetical protein
MTMFKRISAVPPWLNGWSWEGMNAPLPRPAEGNPDRDAQNRWENEGGNPPLTEPPNANPRKHL